MQIGFLSSRTSSFLFREDVTSVLGNGDKEAFLFINVLFSLEVMEVLNWVSLIKTWRLRTSGGAKVKTLPSMQEL